MKKWFLSLLMIIQTLLPVFAQVSQDEIILLQKLDSIKKSNSVSKHFAELYYNTIAKAANFFLNSSKKEKDFIQRFETRFAAFFFNSAEAHLRNFSIPDEAWKTYYADTLLSPVQFRLLGINAHINGDLWQALTSGFSLKEIQENRKSFFSFQKGLARQYREIYAESLKASAKIRLLHAATAGLDKLYGKLMLIRWRKRQMHMAVLYYTNKQKFDTRLRKLQHKMEHINSMILRYL